MDRPMGNEGFIPLNKISMSEECFARFSNFIQGNYGIKMPEIKRTMLESRLQKRLRKLGMACFDEYGDYVFSSEGLANELVHMIDSVTTNKTDFFREPAHFDYLVDHALPELIRTTGAGVRNPLKIWSAGCSSGEEPYTLAMVLNEYAATVQGFDYSILGTDLSVQVLEKAVKGIYKESLVEPVPEHMKKRYILRSKNRENALRILKSHLYEIELQKKREKAAEVEGSKMKIEWGSQIRNYVLHPYKLVKDLRTNLETGNVQSVLDGNLDPFVKAFLMEFGGKN